MSCIRCNETSMNDRFYDQVDEQGQLSLGAWRWASRCLLCGTMVYEPVKYLKADTSACIDRTDGGSRSGAMYDKRSMSRGLLCGSFSSLKDEHEGGSDALSSL
jgi:hypothetical protein